MGAAKWVMGLAMWVGLGGCAGCDEELPLPPESTGLPKSFFVGDPNDPSDDPVFLARFSVGDEPTESVVPGTAVPLLRVRWEIRKDLLVARETDATSQTIGVVAAFPILAHFNPGEREHRKTGEEPDITDSEWTDTSHFRVDWSRNLNVDPILAMTDAALAGFKPTSVVPVAYQADALHPDAPQIRLDEGYVGVATKLILTPGLIEIDDISVPSVWLTHDRVDPNPNPEELTYRSMFLRLNAGDYTPLEWDEARGANVGVGTVTDAGNVYRTRTDLSKPTVWHYAYGSDPAFFESTREAVSAWDAGLRIAARTGEYAACVEAGIEVGGALAQAVASCDAELPVVRSASEIEDAIALVREVDDCRRSADGEGAPHSPGRVDACAELATSRASARGLSSAVVSLTSMAPRAILCNAPVTIYDDPRCVEDLQKHMPADVRAKDQRRVFGPSITPADCAVAWEDRDEGDLTFDACNAAFFARSGDLRFFTLTVTSSAPTRAWSTTTRAADPVTGEIVSADVRISTHATALGAHRAAELLRPGMQAIETQLDALSDDPGAPLRFDARTLVRRMAAFADGRSLEAPAPVAPVAFLDLAPEAQVSARSALRSLSSVRADARVLPASLPEVEARKLSAVATMTDARTITDARMLALGMTQIQRQAVMQELGASNFASPHLLFLSLFGLGDPAVKRRIRDRIRLARTDLGQSFIHADDVASPSRLTVAALAPSLERLFGPVPSEPEEAVLNHMAQVQSLLAARLHRQVTLHQIGRAVGLEPNHAASSYAFGYRPQYWQLRTRNGAVDARCTGAAPPAGCVGPRYLDAPTVEERAQLADSLFARSSVMEIPGDPLDAFATLGSYDIEALRLLHADVVSVGLGLTRDDWTPTALGTLDDPSRAARLDLHGAGDLLGFRAQGGDGTPMSYAELGPTLGLVTDCHTVDVEAFRPEIENVLWDPLLDGGLVEIDGDATRCSAPAADFVPFASLRSATDDERSGTVSYGDQPAIDPNGRIRLATVLGSEEQVDQGNVSAWRGDRGADLYEIAVHRILDSDARIFARSENRGELLPESEIATIARIRHDDDARLRSVVKGLALAKARVDDALVANAPVGATGAALRELLPEHVVASGIVFDELTRRVFQPLSGPYIEPPRFLPDGSTVAMDLTPAMLIAPEGTGFGLEGTVLELPGGMASFQGGVTWGGSGGVYAASGRLGPELRDTPVEAGFVKPFAGATLWIRDDNLFDTATDTALEPSPVALSDLFPVGAQRWLASALTDDRAGAVRVATLEGVPLVDADKVPSLGVSRTTWWTVDPEICFPRAGSMQCSAYHCPEEGCTYAEGSSVPRLIPAVQGAPEADVLVDPLLRPESWNVLLPSVLLHLPVDETPWLDQLAILQWDGAQPLPDDRIELHLMDGRVFYARTMGTEELFGETVQHAVGARLLARLNNLTRAAFMCTEVAAPTGGGTWCIPEVVDGVAHVRFDPLNTRLNNPACTEADDSACNCVDNRACLALEGPGLFRALGIRNALVDMGLSP